MITCQWYYRPDDLQPPSLRSTSRSNELFLSDLTDSNYVGSVLGKVRVSSDPNEGDIVRGPFFCRSSYDPKSRTLKPFVQRSYMASPAQSRKSTNKKKRKRKTTTTTKKRTKKEEKESVSTSEEEEVKDDSTTEQDEQKISEPPIGPSHQVTSIPSLVPRSAGTISSSLQPVYRPVTSVLALLPETLSKVRERLCMKSVGHAVRVHMYPFRKHVRV